LKRNYILSDVIKEKQAKNASWAWIDEVEDTEANKDLYFSMPTVYKSKEKRQL
jgi:hypothetical protein